MHEVAARASIRLRDLSQSGRRLAPLLLLGGLALFPFWGLLSYDPSEGPRSLEGAEAVFFSPTDGNPVLVFAAAAWLLSRRVRLLAATESPGAVSLAALFLVPASVLCVWANYVAAPELLVPSLSLMLLGGAALWRGGRGVRTVLVPALFLLLAYRPPGILINQIVYPLQLATAAGASWYLDLVGISGQRSGDLIFTGGRVFHVIESCAGLRSIETLLMAAVVYAELLGRPARHALLLVVITPFIGALVNQARVLTIVLNPYSEFAAVHTGQGLTMIVVGVLLIAIVDRLILRLPLEGARSLPTPEASRDPLRRVPRLFALGALLAALGVVNWVLPLWTPPRDRDPLLSSLPPSLDGWTAEGLKLDREFLGSVGFSEWVHRRYVKGDREVSLFLGSDDRLEPRASLLSAKAGLPGAGWEPEARRPVRLEPDGLVAEASSVRARNSRALVYHWYTGIEPFAVEALRAVLVLDRGPLRRPGRALVLRATTPLRSKGEDEAQRTLSEFLPLVREALAKPR